MENNKIILVIGATGNQGSAITKHLLQHKKFSVRALVRNEKDEKARALQQLGAQLVTGDLDDRASLDKAFSDVYGVFSMQDFKNGADTEIRQGKLVADAAKAAGISHFVYSSVGSAERNTGIPHFESKFQVEEYIRQIGLPYTILRPVFFMYNFNGMSASLEKGTIFMPLSPDTRLQQLSEEDYGEMTALVFEQPDQFKGRAIELASTALTMTETTAAFSKVLGKEIKYIQVSWEDFEKQAGEELTTMFRWFETTGYNADLPALKKEFNHLSRLEDYLMKITVTNNLDGGSYSVGGGTYHILVSAKETSGAYSLIDMLVPPQSGPVPHSHASYQEAFYVVDGEIEVRTETQTYTARKGAYVNIPFGGLIHQFKNVGTTMAHLLCLITPAGMEKMFEEMGQPVAAGAFLPPPAMTPELQQKFGAIAEKYDQKLYPPDYLTK